MEKEAEVSIPVVQPKKKGIKIPHPIKLLFSVIFFMAVLSYVLPAGQYDRIKSPITGKMVVDPATYHQVENTPVTILQLFSSIPRGMAAGQEIIFFIILVAGAFQIITATGAIEGGIGSLATKLRNKEKIMIPIIMMMFSIGGFTFGMAEENIIFVPIGIALARALGYDALVGMGMITLGASCGFVSGIMNPFSTGIAQRMAELPMFSGIGYRILVWATMMVITATFVVRYARKVKLNPESSLVHELEQEEADHIIDLDTVKQLTGKQKLVLFSVLGAFAYLIYGVFEKGYGMVEIGTIFLILGILAGIIGGLNTDNMIKEFMAGARGMITGAVMVGVARAILVVMQDGQIIDTAIHVMASVVQGLPSSVTALGMYAMQTFLDFFIPSATGQAAATMPIMIPLADVLKINRQVAVLAYQFGDGFTSYILPTSGTLIATLAVARIPYEKWVKFLFPLFVLWLAMGGVFVVIANAIKYGPF